VRHTFCRVFLLAFIFEARLCMSQAPTQIENVMNGVVGIRTTTTGGLETIGTGFIVSNQAGTALIVTVAHVVSGAREVVVEFRGMRNIPVRAIVLQMEPEENGLALLRAVGPIPPDISVLQFDFGSLNADESLRAIGFPVQTYIPWAVMRGRSVGRNGKRLSFSPIIDNGYSGGPLLRENSDTVTGVVTAHDAFYSHAIPADEARLVLRGWGVNLDGNSIITQRTSSANSNPDTNQVRTVVPSASSPNVSTSSKLIPNSLQNSIILNSGNEFDFDDGAVNKPGTGDVLWVAKDGSEYLITLRGCKLVTMKTSYQSATLEEIKVTVSSAAAKPISIAGNSLSISSVFAFLTNQGRYGKMRVDRVASTLAITYTTFK
jgi:hypothetical protein